MNPELMALLQQAQGGSQAQGPSPVAAALQKMMGAGGNAAQQSEVNADQTNDPRISGDLRKGAIVPSNDLVKRYNDANVAHDYGPGYTSNDPAVTGDPRRGAVIPPQELVDRYNATAAAHEGPMSTEEELEMARKGMGPEREPQAKPRRR